MDKRDMRGWLDDHLNQLDWSNGVSKTNLVLSVEDDDALRNMIGQYVAEGHYQSAADVLTVIPEQAWQDAQGDAWHGGETYDFADMNSGFLDSPVARDHSHAEQPSPVNGDESRIGQARSLAAHPQETMTALPPQVIAVGLSALNEGLGQAYNRQPAKAAIFFATGLGLSTISGYNTWVARNIFGARKVRFGPERVRPLLVALWAVTYLYNLWDAWLNASVDE